MRERMALAAERMARATREDSLAAIFRQWPRVPLSRHLRHRATVSDPTFYRERLATLDDGSFERVSAACTSDLLWLVNVWDRQLGQH